MQTRYDVIIVGTNPAGMAAYRSLEAASAKVLLVDAGCAESHTETDYAIVSALNEVAAIFHTRTEFQSRGIYGAREIILDPRSMMAYVKSRVSRARQVRPTLVPGWAKRGKVRVLDDHTVRIGRRVHRADKVILAPSFAYRRPPVPKGWPTRVLYGAELLTLDELPMSAAISGLTALNLSLTLALSRLGVDVVAFERSERLAELTHPDLRSHVLESLNDIVWTRDAYRFVRRRDGRPAIRRGRARIIPDVVLSMERVPVFTPLAYVPPALDYNTTRVGGSNLFVALPHRGMPLSLENLEQAGRVAAHNALVANPRWHKRQLRLVRTISLPEVACSGWIPSDGPPQTPLFEMRLEDRAEGFFARLYIAPNGELIGAESLSLHSRECSSLLAMAVQNRMPAQTFVETVRLLGNPALSETTHHASSAFGK